MTIGQIAGAAVVAHVVMIEPVRKFFIWWFVFAWAVIFIKFPIILQVWAWMFLLLIESVLSILLIPFGILSSMLFDNYFFKIGPDTKWSLAKLIEPRSQPNVTPEQIELTRRINEIGKPKIEQVVEQTTNYSFTDGLILSFIAFIIITLVVILVRNFKR